MFRVYLNTCVDDRSCFSLAVCALISKAEQDAKADCKHDAKSEEWKPKACQLLWQNDSAKLSEHAPAYLSSLVCQIATTADVRARTRLFDVLLYCRGSCGC